MDAFLHPNQISMLFILATVGGIGGLLQGVQTRGFVLPHRRGDERVWEPGFLLDLVFGMAGALVIFLLVPGDMDFVVHEHKVSDTVKVLALALVGGYGAPAIIARALSTALNRLERRLDAHQEQAPIDAKAYELVDHQLSDTTGPVVPEEELGAAIKMASLPAREAIFQMAKDVRQKAWAKRGEKVKWKESLTGRTIAVFRALTETPEGDTRHRYHGQLGYALKDQDEPDWRGARDALHRAIEIADKSHRKVSPFYWFNWVICVIRMEALDGIAGPSDGRTRNEVCEAIRLGSDFVTLKTALESDPGLAAWLARNGLTHAEVGLDGPDGGPVSGGPASGDPVSGSPGGA